MNSQELRALQEAYSQVYAPQELDEVKGIDGHINPNTGKSSYGLDSGLAMTPKKRMETRANSLQKKGEGKRANKIRAVMKRPSMEESFDLYDIILSHLLDEGYASTEESADKIILNMSESWFEDIMELNRYEKETGKDYKTGKSVTKGGTMGGDDTNSKVMRHMHKVMGAGRMGAGGPIQQRGKKNEPGKKPPKAGEYGSERRSPEQIVKNRRAQKQASKDMMHSRYD